MHIFGDYHTHTVYSHGKGTIRENIEAAISKGLREIAITDHGPGHPAYGVSSQNLIKMRKEIDSLQKEYRDIKIMMGVEANLISCEGDIDVSPEDMKLLDKLLVGFHNGALPKNIGEAFKFYGGNYIAKVVPPMRPAMRNINTQAMINAINRYKIDIITHPGAKIDIDPAPLAKAAGLRGTALEINASHGFLTLEYVKIAMKENVMFAIDSDAHIPGNVGNVKKGIDVAEAAGLSSNRIINAE